MVERGTGSERCGAREAHNVARTQVTAPHLDIGNGPLQLVDLLVLCGISEVELLHAVEQHLAVCGGRMSCWACGVAK